MIKRTIKNTLIPIVITFAIYFLVADITYAVRHPEMTDTQRMMHFVDMMGFE